MLGVFFALAVMIGPETRLIEDSALVARLGSPRYAERESAEAALTGRGRAALPALRAAASHRDLEVRTRVAAILQHLENSLVLQATPILLDFRGRPLTDVLRQINERSGLNLQVASREDPSCSSRRVTLEASSPLPFWEAVDRICEAGRLRTTLGSSPDPGHQDDAFVFQDEAAASPGVVSDCGPFRVQLTNIAYQSEISLNRPRPVLALSGGPATPAVDPAAEFSANRQMYLQLLMAAEPRLAITQDGPVRLDEAVDDRGHSLIPPRVTASLSHSSGYFGMNPTPSVRLRVDLARPDDAGRRIVRLKGVIPLMVATRKPGPLVVSLSIPTGRVHRNEDVALVVREVRDPRGDQPAVIELILDAAQGPSRPTLDDDRDLIPSRTDVPHQQLEVLDARGNSLAWFPSATTYAGNETRLTLTIPSSGSTAVPATIRYHGIIRASTEVAFEFRDVPMP